MHGDEFGLAEWLFILLASPVVGAAIGLLFGLWRTRPAVPAISAAIGGAAGTWLGVLFYQWLEETHIGGRDKAILSACALGGFLLGAVLFGAVSTFLATSSHDHRSAGLPLGCTGCGFVLGCVLVTLFGAFLFMLASERSAHIPIDPDVKYLGLACILGGAGTLVIGLSILRARAKS